MKLNTNRHTGMLLSRASLLYDNSNDKVFIKYNLTSTSWAILKKIAMNPRQSTHALAEMCLVTDQSFGQIVAKLAQRGLVERIPTTGRAILHEITEKGQSVLKDIDPQLEESLTRFFGALTRKEVKALGDLLERLALANGSAIFTQSIRDLVIGETND